MLQPRRTPTSLGQLSIRLFAFFVIAFTCSSSFAQTVHPLAEQWTDKRVERERTIFLRRSWQISDTQFNNQIKAIDGDTQQLVLQIQKQPRDVQVQIRQQSDSLFNVRIVPLREQWQRDTAEREKKIRADIASDAQQAGQMQAARTILNERMQRREISPGDFSREDQNLQQNVFALQTKWDNVDPNWGRFFTASWQRVQPGALAEMRKKDATADDQDVRTLAELAVQIQHNSYLREKRAITPEEEAQRNSTPTMQMASIQAKYSSTSARSTDFRMKVQKLVQSMVQQQRPQWDAELRATVPSNPPNAPRGGNGGNTPTAAGGDPTPPVQTEPPAANNRSKAYLKEMPDPARVERQIQYADQPEMIACQMGAFTWLKDVIYQMNGTNIFQGNPNLLSADERRLIAAYDAERARIMKFDHSGDFYSFNTGYRTYVVQQLFAPGSAVYRANFNQPADPAVPCGALKAGVPAVPGIRNLSSRIVELATGFALPFVIMLGLAGVGYFAYSRRGKVAPAPAYSEVKPSQMPTQTHTETAPRRVSFAPAAHPASASVKEQLFAEQKEKYQLRYTEVADELTAASAELTQMQPVLEGVQSNLKLLAKTVVTRIEGLVQLRYGVNVKLLLKVALKALVLTIVIAAVLTMVVSADSPMFRSDITLVIIYAGAAALLFFRERRKQVKIPLSFVKNHAESLKNLSLAYVYEGQVPQLVDNTPMLQALRISATSQNPQEGMLPAAKIGPGNFLLMVGDDMAHYRMDANGTIALVSSNSGSMFMSTHGGLLTQAVSEQRGFAAKTIPPMLEYIRVAARRRRAAEELPGLEKLLKDVNRLETVWRDTYTSDEVFEFLLRRIDLFNMCDSATSLGILLYGYQGNGKTYLARKIADSVSARFEEVNGAKLTSADEVKAVWDRNRRKGPVVLFVQNAERVFPKPGSENAGGGTREAALAWIREWELQEVAQSRIWVVMTTENEQEIHPGIIGLFSDSKIEIAPPDSAGRTMILRAACKEHRMGEPPAWVVQNTGGRSIRELLEIVKSVKRVSAPVAPTDEHWQKAVPGGAEDPWQQLILPQEMITRLKTLCSSLRIIDTLQKQGHEPPRGALLHGSPGTGKTEIARILSKASGLPFIHAAPADLKAGYLGQAGQKVAALFNQARGKAPCILFIDEFDASAPTRGGQHADQLTDEIVNNLLDAMDGVQKSNRPVFVVAATNHPDRIDPAILSRFSYKFEIPLPDLEARTRIFKVILSRQKRVDFDIDQLAAELARKTPNRSGRDIDNLVRAASQSALERAFRDGTPDKIVLTREDFAAQLAPATGGVTDEELDKIWNKIVLRPDIKDAIKSKIRLFNKGDKAAPRGLLLYGPPGTGKSEIARLIKESTKGDLQSLTVSSLKAGHVGQTAQLVKQVWDKARMKGRCVIFVDECEGVFGRRGGLNTDAFSEDLVREFLAQWDGVGLGGQIWVVGATNHKEVIDEAILSRFGAEIEIGLPGAAERLEILQLEIEKLEREIVIPEFVPRDTVGFAGRTLATLARDVCTIAAERNDDITPTVWKKAIDRLRGAEHVSDDTWENLVVSQDTLSRLQTVCNSLRSVEILRKKGMDLPRGVLLYGKPGTGKTQIARTLAHESGLSFIAAGPADLKAPYTGQSIQKVKELFDRARAKSPAILFIDEFDASAPTRGSEHADQFTNEIVDELLKQTDGVKKSAAYVFVVAATNYLERIDDAVKSRFFEVEVPLPDEQQRVRLFKIALGRLQQVDFNVDDIAVELASKTAGFSGRRVVDLITAASQRALDRGFQRGNIEEVVVTAEDLRAQLAPKGKTIADEDLQKIWSEVVLNPTVKKAILSKVQMFNTGDKAAPRGLLLYGPPGTGKTEIARRIAKSTNSEFEGLSIASLKAGFEGQSAQLVRKLWEKARSRGRFVIFVDECEGVFGRRGGVNTSSFTEDIVQEFLSQWDGVGSTGQVWVIGATNRRDRLDEAIVSRFGAAFEIGLPEAAERLEILRIEMRKLERDVEVPDFVGSLTTGLSGRGLSTLARDVCTIAADRKTAVTPEIWREAIGNNLADKTIAVGDDVGWNTLILPDATLEQLQTIAGAVRNVEVLRKEGFEPTRGALLWGPPGTGKTQIARTLAKESGVAFVDAGLSDLKAGFVGQSVLKVKELFQRARDAAPCILFIDEIDAAVPDRGGAKADQYTIEIVNEFLQQMDGVKKDSRYIFVLAATNLPGLVDPAMLSRFEEQIQIGLPGPAERQKLFKLFLSKQRTDFDTEALAAELAIACGEIGGRDIQSLVRRASRRAVQRGLKSGALNNLVLTREDVMSQVTGTRAEGASHG